MTLSLDFIPYLLVTAGVTYLIRLIPLLLVKKQIQNRFLLSFLHYIPYSILTIMTIPAIFYATETIFAAFVGFLIALFFAYKEKSLVEVSGIACFAVLLMEILTDVWKS